MMGIGLALATLGAILRYAVDDNSDTFDLDTVGLIMIIVGTVAFATGVGLEVLRSKRPAPVPYPPQPVAYPPQQMPYAQTPPIAPPPAPPPAPPHSPPPPPPSHPH